MQVVKPDECFDTRNLYSIHKGVLFNNIRCEHSLKAVGDSDSRVGTCGGVERSVGNTGASSAGVYKAKNNSYR